MHICKSCQRLFLTPQLRKRSLPCGVDVYSFYDYHDNKSFILTKHTDLGYHIYNILAKNSFFPFGKAFVWERTVASVAIDDRPKSGYSHTAILNKALASKTVKPRFARLIARNDVSYSGKTKNFRLQNPRDFHYKPFEENEVIVVDDIVTTGTTLCEAVAKLKQNGKEVLFCLTLADVIS